MRSIAAPERFEVVEQVMGGPAASRGRRLRAARGRGGSW